MICLKMWFRLTHPRTYPMCLQKISFAWSYGVYVVCYFYALYCTLLVGKQFDVNNWLIAIVSDQIDESESPWSMIEARVRATRTWAMVRPCWIQKIALVFFSLLYFFYATFSFIEGYLCESAQSPGMWGDGVDMVACVAKIFSFRSAVGQWVIVLDFKDSF